MRAGVCRPAKFFEKEVIEDSDHRKLCASATASGPRLLPPCSAAKTCARAECACTKGCRYARAENGEGIASASDSATTIHIIRILRRNPPQRCCLRCVSVHCGPRRLSRRPSPVCPPWKLTVPHPCPFDQGPAYNTGAPWDPLQDNIAPHGHFEQQERRHAIRIVQSRGSPLQPDALGAAPRPAVPVATSAY